ncbi:MAG: hypothetical protein Q9187_006315 [Circinaria calcarea]
MSPGNLADKANASPPYTLSGKRSESDDDDFNFNGLNPTAAASFRLESLVKTISSGMPGFTKAALIYSVPRSIPKTAEAAEAVDI